jgi:hypothetical protein
LLECFSVGQVGVLDNAVGHLTALFHIGRLDKLAEYQGAGMQRTPLT